MEPNVISYSPHMDESLKFPLPKRNIDVIKREQIYISPQSGEVFSPTTQSMISITLPKPFSEVEGFKSQSSGKFCMGN